MVNYFKGGITDTKAKLVIDISFLEFLIKNNSRKALIEALRSLDYGSQEYQDAKFNIAYVTPHGTFKDVRNNDNVKKLSGYLYFYIDRKDSHTTTQSFARPAKTLCAPTCFYSRFSTLAVLPIRY